MAGASFCCNLFHVNEETPGPARETGTGKCLCSIRIQAVVMVKSTVFLTLKLEIPFNLSMLFLRCLPCAQCCRTQSSKSPAPQDLQAKRCPVFVKCLLPKRLTTSPLCLPPGLLLFLPLFTPSHKAVP